MGEWKALADLIGVGVVETLPFILGLFFGSLLLFALGPSLVSHFNSWKYIVVGVVGSIGWTIWVGLFVLDTYEVLVAEGETSGVILGMLSILPYIVFLIVILGEVSYTIVLKENKGGEKV